MSGRLIIVLTVLLVRSAVCGAGSEAKCSVCGSQIAAIGTALDMFEVDCERYPTIEEGLVALIECPSDDLSNRWHGPYLSKRGILSDEEPDQVVRDPWGHAFVYRYPGIHNTNGYDLYSLGPDGISKTGGEDADDIGSWGKDEPQFDISADTVVVAIAAVAFPILCARAFRTWRRH
jgi:general secretion pathway protein G